jgi:hypothetical protein
MTVAGTATSPLSELEHRVQLRRAVIASTIGTTIEWYDFFLYSTVTGLVFAKLYFPGSDPLVGTLQAFATAANIDVAVVRVAAETVTPSGQLLVEIVEHEIA